MTAIGTEELPPKDPPFMAASGTFLESCYITISDSVPVLVKNATENDTLCIFFCNAFLFLLA